MRIAKQLLIVAAALGATGLISCSIPKPECTVGQSGYLGGLSGNDYLAFAVRYIPKDAGSTCPVMTGEMVGMQSYHPAKEGDEQNRDFSKTTIAIRTQSSGELFWMMEDLVDPELARVEKPNAEGPFVAAEPDSTDFCQVNEITESRVNFPGSLVPLADPGCTMDEECPDATGVASSTCQLIDAANEVRACSVVYEPTDLIYHWSNVQVYVTAGSLGTQFKADVEIIINGCAAQYTAVGMWPAVDCTDYYLGTFEPKDILCDPDPDPTGERDPLPLTDPETGQKIGIQRPFGSGINPDFGPTKCDTNISVIPIVDQFYTELVFGGPISVPRCALSVDEIPALEGYTPPEGGGGAGGGG